MSRTGAAPARASLVRRADLAGLTLVSALVGWAIVAHPSAPGTSQFALAAAAGTTAWWLGATLARAHPAVAGATAVAFVGGFLATGYPAPLSGTTSPPLGYENAHAALVAVATVGLLLAARSVGGPISAILYATAALTPFVNHYIGSRAGTLTCILLLLVWPLTRYGPRNLWRGLSGAVLAGGTIFVALAGATHETTTQTMVGDQLTGARLSLWADALSMAREQPLAGAGPGSFATTSPTALSDNDLAWAHSAPLQLVAETGLVGLLIVVLLGAWMVWRLGHLSIVLAVLALQPLVDYVLHFVVVLCASAFVLGALGTVDRRTRSDTARNSEETAPEPGAPEA